MSTEPTWTGTMVEVPRDQALDFAVSDQRAGFRLQRCEVYNWGTLQEHVWSLMPRVRRGW